MSSAPSPRLGIFGGSFDPVHYGHLLLAECCREQAHLDEIWFLPAAAPPHKQGKKLAPAKARLEMLELATAGNEAYRVSSLEIDRGGVRYTVDTLRAVAETHPQAEVFLLMGADSLRDLPTWREPAEILSRGTPIVVRRAGSAEPDFTPLADFVAPTRLQEIAASQVLMPLIELSSTELRQRASEGRSLRYRTPRAVEKYIETQRLYSSP